MIHRKKISKVKIKYSILKTYCSVQFRLKKALYPTKEEEEEEDG
jgi:hypothetical protein